MPTFGYTGAQQSYVVPAGVSIVKITAYGAQGGGTYFGKGAMIQSYHVVTPGETLYVYVGGRGGYNGGGAAGSRNGGGASDVRRGGAALSNRIVAAGGGGGGSSSSLTKNGGGNGGYPSGGSGGGSVNSGGGAMVLCEAHGGTATAGGTVTGGYVDQMNVKVGALGIGGAGTTHATWAGGGGGGGWYGGAGGPGQVIFTNGNVVCGGGGGSSRTLGTLISAESSSTASRTGDGAVVIDAMTTAAPGLSTPTLDNANTVKFTVTHQAPAVAMAQYGEVQLSQASDFSSGVTTITGVESASLSHAFAWSALKQGTWYLRARTRSASGTISAWSVTRSVVVSHSPAVTAVSPVGGGWALYGAGTVELTFRATDAYSLDKISVYDIEIFQGSTPVIQTGQVSVMSNLGTDIKRTFTIPAVNKNLPLQWRVRVRDSVSAGTEGGAWSSWSAWNTFYLGDAPTVAITSPTVDQIVSSGAPTFTWSRTTPSGQSIKTTWVEVRDQVNNALVWSKTLTTQTSVTPEQTVLVNNKQYRLHVTVEDAVGLRAQTSVAFSAQFASPDPIAYEIDQAGLEAMGYVLLDWSAAVPDPDHAAWNVYRREVGSGEGWMLLQSRESRLQTEYRDYFVASGSTYQYAVTQIAYRFGDYLESPLGMRLLDPTDPGTAVVEERTYTIPPVGYWIIDEDDPNLSVHLPSVTAESMTDEYEQEVYAVPGRGRRVDEGERLGYSGDLTVQIRQGDGQSLLRKAVSDMRKRKNRYWLRRPYGEMFPVSIGNIGWTPLAGTGSNEMGDMTIPYLETF